MPHEWKTEKYLEVEDVLGFDLGVWLNDLRPLSWQRISREIWAKTDMDVSHETARNWWIKWTANVPLGERKTDV